MGAWSCGLNIQKFLREPAVLDRIPISRATLWAWIQQGQFPKPVRLGPNTVAWQLDDIDTWSASRVPDKAPKQGAKDRGRSLRGKKRGQPR